MIGGSNPSPRSSTVTVALSGSFDAIVSVASERPVEVGANVAIMSWLPPGSSEKLARFTVNAAWLDDISLTTSGSTPSLEIRIVWGMDPPTKTGPKSTDDSERTMAGPLVTWR